ncbi:beta-ketoacyl-ACP reductase [Candidatus Woesearchaeota archaeon]|nr:MAG: beta-ketoacyl-ACP reductase [Candidatus Woesearchaeota archaeon]
MKLKNKVAIVTGARRGIGKAIALEFAKQGCNIVVSDINKRDCHKVCNEIMMKNRKALAVKCDISKKKEVEELIKKTMQRFNRLDILVNNASVLIEKPLIEMTEKDWDYVININLKGTFLCSQTAAKVMLKQKSGKIISLSSIAGQTAFPGLAAYCASKAGIINLTKAMALELAPYVNVNAIAPGVIKTKMTEPFLNNQEVKKQFLEKIPLGRIGKPEEIAKTAVFLASNDSSFMTGETVFVDGGWLTH